MDDSEVKLKKVF